MDIIIALQWFLAGGFVVFFMNIAWELHKKSIREKILMSLVSLELTTYSRVLKYNITVLKRNNQALNKGKDTTDTLIPFQNNFWDLIIYNGIPKIFFKHKKGKNGYVFENVDTFVKLKFIHFMIDLINGQIKSRENFKVNNKALASYKDALISYNNMLLNTLKDLDKAVPETISSLDSLIQEMDTPLFKKLLCKIKKC